MFNFVVEGSAERGGERKEERMRSPEGQRRGERRARKGRGEERGEPSPKFVSKNP